MKKLITNINGGMPDLLDNIRWMEAGMMEAIEGICKGLAMGHNSYKVFGCQVTRNGTSVSVSKGIIFHNGELYNVNASSFSAPADHVLFWYEANQYDETGLLTFQNGQQHDVYFERKMALASAPSFPGDVIADVSLVSLNHAILPKMGRVPLWSVATNQPSSNVNTDGLIYRMDAGGLVIISGNFNHTYGELIGYYLPPFLRPAASLSDEDIFPVRVGLEGGFFITGISSAGVLMSGSNPATPPNSSWPQKLDQQIVYQAEGGMVWL